MSLVLFCWRWTWILVSVISRLAWIFFNCSQHQESISVGHFSGSHRYRFLWDLAFEYAFLLDALEYTPWITSCREVLSLMCKKVRLRAEISLQITFHIINIDVDLFVSCLYHPFISHVDIVIHLPNWMHWWNQWFRRSVDHHHHHWWLIVVFSLVAKIHQGKFCLTCSLCHF